MLVTFAAILMAGVQVAPRYYTLREFGSVLAAQQIPNTVSPDCADDVFAVRLAKSSPNDIASALEASGRLTVDRSSSGWKIRRSDSFRTAERKLDAYLAEMVAADLARRMQAIKIARELWPLSPDQRALELSRMNFGTATAKVEATVQQLVQNVLSDSIWAFLAVPVDLAGAGRKGVGSLRVVEVAQRPELFFPTPDRKGVAMFDPRGPYGTPPDIAGAKISFDPISAGANLRLIFGNVKSKIALGRVMPLILIRDVSERPPASTKVLTAADQAAYRDRIAKSPKETQDPIATKVVPLPSVPMRVSEAMLRVAEKADQDIVCYVSPLSDRVLRPSASTSIQTLISRADSADFDVDSEESAIRERAGFNRHPASGTVDWPSLSAKKCGNALSIRTETDFLDLLVEGPPTLPTAIENNARAGKAPSLADLTAVVSTLKPATWSGSTFSSHFLTYTNPLAFYPFARALAASPDLAKSVAAVAETAPLEIVYKDLPKSVQEALRSGIMEAGSKCDQTGVGYFRDPIASAEMARGDIEGRVNSLRLKVTRKKDTLEFAFVDNIYTHWYAWVKNIGGTASQ